MSDISCKYCQSENVIKYGLYKDVQRYFCKECKRKFVSTDTIPKMQYATHKVSDAINMYYEGMSLNEIRRNFIQQHNDYISDVSALNWVSRFSKLAIMEAGKYKPGVSGVWVLSLLFLRRFIGSIILGIWGLVLNPLCKIPSVQRYLKALDSWLLPSLEKSSDSGIDENYPPRKQPNANKTQNK